MVSMDLDELPTEALRKALRKRGIATEEKKMFGGVCFLLGGNMLVGVMASGEIMGRVDPAHGPALAASVGGRPMEQAGRTMWGFILAPVRAADALTEASLVYVSTLPVKGAPKKKK